MGFSFTQKWTETDKSYQINLDITVHVVYLFNIRTPFQSQIPGKMKIIKYTYIWFRASQNNW